MSLVIGTSAQRGFTPHTVAAAAQSYIDLLDATVGGAGPTRDWNMDETSGSTMAARVGGVDGSYQNSPKLALDALVQDPGGRKAIGVRSGKHVTIVSPLTSASFTIAFPFQPDKAKSKHVNLTTGQTTGGFSLEWIDDGASGIKVRFWRVDSGGTPVIYEGSSTAQLPIGTTSMIFFSSDGSTGSLDVHVGDGTSVTKLSVTNTSGTPPASWPNLPSSTTWRFGVWVDGSTDPTDGVLGPPTMWDSVLSSAAMDSLNVPQSILWIDAAINMQSVLTGQTVEFALAPFVHPEIGYTVTVDTQPSGDEAAAANGLNVDITGGADPVTDTTFTLHLTKGALTSQTCTGTFDVEESAGSSESLQFVHYWFGTRSGDIWHLQEPQLMTITDVAFTPPDGLVASRQSAGVKVLRQHARGDFSLSQTASEIAQIFEDSLTDFGENFDGIDIDEISTASQDKIDLGKLILDAGAIFKANNPAKIFAVYHTPAQPEQWLFDALAADSELDFVFHEMYQCCGTPCDPDLSIVESRCTTYAAQSATVRQKVVVIINLGWPGQPNCDTRPTTSYFDAQIEKAWDILSDAAGIGTASGTSGTVSGVDYDDYDPIVRASSWASRIS